MLYLGHTHVLYQPVTTVLYLVVSEACIKQKKIKTFFHIDKQVTVNWEISCIRISMC